MTDIEQRLRQELANLLGDSAPAPPDDALAHHLDNAQNAANRILDLFTNINEQNNGLTEELLTYYEQINTAFNATSAFAHCKSVEQALPVLARELSLAVQGRFAYYRGTWANNLVNHNHPLIPADLPTVAFAEDHLLPDAHDFYARHAPEIQNLAQTAHQPAVAMIGYHAPYNHDHIGRGNVLALPLVSPDANENFGHVILVRTSDQEPFAAIDMGLAQSIAHMSVAVLDNITYARKLQDAGLQTVAALARAMEAKDAYTSGHSSRVSQLAVQLGRYVRLSPPELQTLEWAGLLHDIGKIGIRENVLTKPGRLTEEEFEHIKSHPVQSCNMLEPIDALRDVVPAVRHHHEHWDGSGYPDGLVAQNIPLLARVLQVADVYDALTSNRSYRAAMPDEKAFQILTKDAGRILDPNLVQSFLQMMSEHTPA